VVGWSVGQWSRLADGEQTKDERRETCPSHTHTHTHISGVLYSYKKNTNKIIKIKHLKN